VVSIERSSFEDVSAGLFFTLSLGGGEVAGVRRGVAGNVDRPKGSALPPPSPPGGGGGNMAAEELGVCPLSG
jgi:hypothetical protein